MALGFLIASKLGLHRLNYFSLHQKQAKASGVCCFASAFIRSCYVSCSVLTSMTCSYLSLFYQKKLLNRPTGHWLHIYRLLWHSILAGLQYRNMYEVFYEGKRVTSGRLLICALFQLLGFSEYYVMYVHNNCIPLFNFFLAGCLLDLVLFGARASFQKFRKERSAKRD